uniref:Transcription initiation factor IIA subunit 1 n=1 Tax=Romanomermis culicivorax TaxID=13658 RepID=A0A915IVE1_ROMCU
MDGLASSSLRNTSSLYKNVIDDVIRNVKEAFNDEGVDEAIIKELKELWEQKLTATKAIEPDEKVRSRNQNMNVMTNFSFDMGYQNAIGINQRATNYQHGTPMAARNVGAVIQSSNFVQRMPAVRFMDGLPVVLGGANRPSTSTTHQSAFTLPVSISAATQNSPTTTIVGRQQPQQQIRYLILPQISASTAASNVIVSSSGGATVARPQVAVRDNSGQPQQHLTLQTSTTNTKSNTNNIVQLDGPPDANISDDDDEDFDNIEEDAADDVDEDEENANFVEDVEPLNSDDDDLINENADELFEADDIIVCQYENIVRTRSKWKLLLKDGIMNLNGKDYVFNKASGETEF